MTSASLPKHVAIIMDGNGRWAKMRGLPRFQGHREGVKRVEEIIDAASNLGIKFLTLYTFSKENWRRPKDEVSVLMKTFCMAIDQKAKKMHKANIRFQCIGQRDAIPADVLKRMDAATQLTRNNTGLAVTIAFNYGSRTEILDAVKDIAGQVKKGKLSIDEITERVFSQTLYTKDMPDPDLLIRTSGELRISNFLLWQLSYTELYFTNKFWPEFHVSDFKKAILEYEQRERRYGKVSAKR